MSSRASRRSCRSYLLIYTSWYWASQLYTTEHATEAVTIVENIQTINICSMIVVLYCFINLELSLGVTLIDTRNWRQWCNSVRTINEIIDPFDVTAGIGSHLVTSSFVRRLQCVLLSVIYSWGMDILIIWAFRISSSVNCLLIKLFMIISPDMGLPTRIQRAVNLPIAELFNFERWTARFFSKF